MLEIKSLASGSSGNAYRVSDFKTPLLLECGIPYKKLQEGLEFRLSEIEGCLITHEHKDHCKALNEVTRAGINCHMSSGTKKALIDDEFTEDNHRLVTHKLYDPFKIGSWIVKPFEAEHDAAEPFNYLLWSRETGDKLVYITDSFYSKFKFNDLNYIMIECNYSKKILDENIAAGRVLMVQKNRLLKSHFSLKNVKDFLKANDLSKVNEIHLLHLSNRNSDANLFKKEIQELTGKLVYVAGGDD
jgi:phosphoribosyl 1,2-cyclic phosphodiesterase